MRVHVHVGRQASRRMDERANMPCDSMHQAPCMRTDRWADRPTSCHATHRRTPCHAPPHYTIPRHGIPYGAVWRGVLRCNAVRRNAVRCTAVQFGAMRCSVCMRVCVRASVCMQTCMYVYAHACMHRYACRHTYMYACCLCISMHACVHARIPHVLLFRVDSDVCRHECVRMYVHV